MDAWTLIAEELKKIGIQLILKPCDHPTYHTLIRQDLNPLVLYDGGRENADMVLAQYYHSDSIVATGKKPVTNFSHMGAVDADGDGKIDSIDDLIAAARTEVDEKKQERLWKDAQIKLLKALASYPLYHVNIALAKKPYVSWGYELKVIPDFPIANETTKILPR
jgi:peptide/nickel transport system substrate-binding protein